MFFPPRSISLTSPCTSASLPAPAVGAGSDLLPPAQEAGFSLSYSPASGGRLAGPPGLSCPRSPTPRVVTCGGQGPWKSRTRWSAGSVQAGETGRGPSAIPPGRAEDAPGSHWLEPARLLGQRSRDLSPRASQLEGQPLCLWWDLGCPLGSRPGWGEQTPPASCPAAQGHSPPGISPEARPGPALGSPGAAPALSPSAPGGVFRPKKLGCGPPLLTPTLPWGTLR